MTSNLTINTSTTHLSTARVQFITCKTIAHFEGESRNTLYVVMHITHNKYILFILKQQNTRNVCDMHLNEAYFCQNFSLLSRDKGTNFGGQHFQIDRFIARVIQLKHRQSILHNRQILQHVISMQTNGCSLLGLRSGIPQIRFPMAFGGGGQKCPHQITNPDIRFPRYSFPQFYQ